MMFTNLASPFVTMSFTASDFSPHGSWDLATRSTSFDCRTSAFHAVVFAGNTADFCRNSMNLSQDACFGEVNADRYFA